MMQKYNFIPSFLAICYYISWAIIFIIYTSSESDIKCKALVQWDRALITVLLFISAINLFTALINYSFSYKNVYLCSGISVCKSCLNYIGGIWIMIGIINAYCSIGNNNALCKSLKQANLAYIIIEMAIIGNCCFFVFAMCIIGQYRKQKTERKVQNQETEIIDEECDI